MRVNQPLLIRARPCVRSWRSEMAEVSKIATGSFGGVPARIFITASRQNWRRIRPIVGEEVVSGIMERETFNARSAM